MAVVNITKLESLKTGDVLATGAMATSLTAVYGMLDGSVNLNIGEPETTEFFVEESDIAYASSDGKREVDLTVEMVGVEASVLAPLIGGTFVAKTVTDPESISMPPANTAVFKAVELSGKNSDGLPVVVALPKCKIISSTSGAVGKGQLKGFTLKCKVLVPVNGSGVAQPWMKLSTGLHS